MNFGSHNSEAIPKSLQHLIKAFDLHPSLSVGIPLSAKKSCSPAAIPINAPWQINRYSAVTVPPNPFFWTIVSDLGAKPQPPAPKARFNTRLYLISGKYNNPSGVISMSSESMGSSKISWILSLKDSEPNPWKESDQLIRLDCAICDPNGESLKTVVAKSDIVPVTSFDSGAAGSRAGTLLAGAAASLEVELSVRLFNGVAFLAAPAAVVVDVAVEDWFLAIGFDCDGSKNSSAIMFQSDTCLLARPDACNTRRKPVPVLFNGIPLRWIIVVVVSL